jgi:hypothetical protein
MTLFQFAILRAGQQAEATLLEPGVGKREREAAYRTIEWANGLRERMERCQKPKTSGLRQSAAMTEMRSFANSTTPTKW